jgi:hypothetical protein
MQIIVNGKTIVVSVDDLTFEDVVGLANTSQYASVTYRRASGPKTEGILMAGQSIKIQEGTVINAFVTGDA